MVYYNATSPRQDHSAPYTPPSTYSSGGAPVAPRSTKPSSNNNTFVSTTPTYISSPFDDDPVDTHEKNHSNNATPYNPDYMSSPYTHSNSNSPNYSHSQTHEYALSPSFTEKGLATGAAVGGGTAAAGGLGGQTYAMQHLNGNHPTNAYDPYHDNNQQQLNSHQFSNDAAYNNNSYNNSRESYGYNQSNPNYYNGYDEDRPSLSNDTAPMRPHTDMETSDGLTRSKSGVTRVKYGQKEKSKYLPCFPCIRSTCGRVTCCCCLFLLLIIIALVIVVFVVFKLPTVNYLGMQSDPQFAFNQGNTTLQVQLVANIEVKNPNPIGFKFESIVATAYYPNYAPSIGGGNLTNVDFPSKSTKTIAFPILAAYSRSQDTGYTVVKDILTRCGELGAAKTQLTINYDLKLTIRIIGIAISPTIKNQNVHFDCPADIGSIGSNIPGGIGALMGGSA
ncbi:hypothetical protein EDD11_003426 [Mortierella claussenii]|nr:hypothetical protein EDD11_003426 [Mortierella claussenii]